MRSRSNSADGGRSAADRKRVELVVRISLEQRSVERRSVSAEIWQVSGAGCRQSGGVRLSGT